MESAALTVTPLAGGADELRALARSRPLLLVFAHRDCPTSALALRHLRAAGSAEPELVIVAEEPPQEAARLMLRAGLRAPVLAQEAPFAASSELGVEAVPTAVLLDPGGAE